MSEYNDEYSYIDALEGEERRLAILEIEAEACHMDYMERCEELKTQAEFIESSYERFSNLPGLAEQLSLVKAAEEAVEKAKQDLANRLDELDVISQLDGWEQRCFTVKNFDKPVEVCVYYQEGTVDPYATRLMLEGARYALDSAIKILALAGIHVVRM